MQIIIAMLFVLCVFGCSTSNQNIYDVDFISTYSHPVYGVVDDRSQKLNEDRESCRVNTYRSGVSVGGVLVTDQKRLNEIAGSYRALFFGKKSEVYVMNDKSLANNLDYLKNAPSYISEIKNKQQEFSDCFRVEKKYSLMKTNVYSKKTGKLLFSKEHR